MARDVEPEDYAKVIVAYSDFLLAEIDKSNAEIDAFYSRHGLKRDVATRFIGQQDSEAALHARRAQSDNMQRTMRLVQIEAGAAPPARRSGARPSRVRV